MTIVAFLQNQWFKDPARMIRLRDKFYVGKNEKFVSDFLFFGCQTGKVLRSVFGEDLTGEIIWENVSNQIGGKSDSKFPPDPVHIQGVIAKFPPDIVLTFGKIAEAGIEAVESKNFKWLKGPHPAARGPDVWPALRKMAADLNKLRG